MKYSIRSSSSSKQIFVYAANSFVQFSSCGNLLKMTGKLSTHTSQELNCKVAAALWLLLKPPLFLAHHAFSFLFTHFPSNSCRVISSFSSHLVFRIPSTSNRSCSCFHSYNIGILWCTVNYGFSLFYHMSLHFSVEPNERANERTLISEEKSSSRNA